MGSLMMGISGVRGIIGESLTPELLLRLGQAYATYLGGGRVVVGRDTRVSGEMVKHSVLAGLLSSGCSIVDVGVATTPTVAIMIGELGADGGIVISASHNPIEWNALKFFCPDGVYLDATQGRALLDIYYQGDFLRAKWHQIREVETSSRAPDVHLKRVMGIVDVDAIRRKRFRVALDSCNGAGVEITTRLLTELGCDVVRIHCTPDGLFPHDPEPTFENLQDLCKLVREDGRIDAAFAQDPDADRLAVVNEKGAFIGEEYTLALVADYVLQRRPGKVVINMSTSRAIEDIAKKHGSTCERVAVGEVNVASRMRNVGATIGGEGNGGVIDPRVHFGRDSLTGMVLILEYMAKTGRKLSEMVDALPHYHMLKTKADCSRRGLPAVLAAMRREGEASGARVNELDGLRLDWPDAWVHVRPSNTEPIVRVIGEAAERSRVEQLVSSHVERVRELGGEEEA